MSNFNSVSPDQKPLDPYKRVKYTMGLVLGVDEFEQEQFYLMERDRLHNRALHGYGTAAGLKVSVKEDSGVPTVTVSPGLAVNPKGETICVPVPQCASLTKWLQDNPDKVAAQLGSPAVGGTLTLYVVLCYKECPTDYVPIPGTPCRTGEDAMGPSRTADYFELSLTTTPPEQLEEEYVRCFGKFLRRIEIFERAVSPLDKDAVLTALKEYFAGMGSPPDCSSEPEGLPPEDNKLYILPGDADEILEAVFRLWVTKIRPELLRKSGTCGEYAGKPESMQNCVLLAQLDMNIEKSGDTWALDGDVTGIEIDEDQRPILLHTRLLQEWMLCARYSPVELAPRTFATVFMLDDNTLRAWIHHPELLNPPPPDSVYFYLNGTQHGFVSVTPYAGTNVFDLGFDNTNEDKSRFMKFNDRVGVRFDASAIAEIVSPVQPLSEVLKTSEYDYIDRFENFIWSYFYAGLPVLNDLADVDAASPGDGQYLTWIDATGKWEPTDKPLHNDLEGRDAPDAHPQYLTEAEGNDLYAPKDHNHPHVLNFHNDVAISGPLPGQVLTRLGNQWVNKALPSLNHVLDFHDDVNIFKPEDGQVLTRDGTQWVNKPLPPGGLSPEEILEKIAAQLPVLPFVTIDTDRRPTIKERNWLPFRLWFHLNHETNARPRLNEISLTVHFEWRKRGCLVTGLDIRNLQPVPGYCNVFTLEVDVAPILELEHSEAFFRFVFELEKMIYTQSNADHNLIEWMKGQNLKWLGHNGGNTVTAFYHYEPKAEKTSQSGIDVVAAGKFDGKGIARGKTIGNLHVLTDADPGYEPGLSGAPYIYDLTFDGYDPEATYIVKGTPSIGSPDEKAIYGFEVLDVPGKILVRVKPGNNESPPYGFLIKISQIL